MRATPDFATGGLVSLLASPYALEPISENQDIDSIRVIAEAVAEA